jgi:tRNA (cmo5U34)-methyltransferase
MSVSPPAAPLPAGRDTRRAAGRADVNMWQNAQHAQGYLERRRRFPRRQEGYETLMEFLPRTPRRVLDLGCGDGEVAARVVEAHPGVEVLACDFSPEMLQRARQRFDGSSVEVVEHDLDTSLPAAWGTFDAVVSAFAIHHVVDGRKRALYGEVHEHLSPAGVFCNLEHVDSPTPELHEAFLVAMGVDEDDPSNKLAAVETQLRWLRDVGFEHVDCHWKWREMALLAGVKSPA